MNEPLKLQAQDQDDVTVISTLLQDAVILHSELRYEPSRGTFGLIAQRYGWENGEQPHRVNTRLTVSGVTKVATRGLPAPGDAVAPTAMIVLAVEQDAQSLTIRFTGGTALRLTLIDGWRLHFEDFGPEWPCQCPAAHQTA